MQEYYRRLAVADKNFLNVYKGVETDMGFYVIFGEPNKTAIL
jgi:GWxTD domain-containing protein